MNKQTLSEIIGMLYIYKHEDEYAYNLLLKYLSHEIDLFSYMKLLTEHHNTDNKDTLE